MNGQVQTFSPLTPYHFPGSDCRLVVGGVLYDEEGVYLVKPAKARYHDAYMFPQEKAKWGRDRSFRDVAFRGLHEELGLGERDVSIHLNHLSWFENHVPSSRGAERMTKHIVYFAVSLQPFARFTLNSDEIAGMVCVGDFEEYLVAMEHYAEKRPARWIGQLDALKIMLQRGFLPECKWGGLKDFENRPQ